MEIIQELKYDETMKTTVEPYLKQRCISGYTDSYDAVGKLHFTGRLSCVAAGTLRTWMELSPDERFFSGTY